MNPHDTKPIEQNMKGVSLKREKSDDSLSLDRKKATTFSRTKTVQNPLLIRLLDDDNNRSKFRWFF